MDYFAIFDTKSVIQKEKNSVKCDYTSKREIPKCDFCENKSNLKHIKYYSPFYNTFLYPNLCEKCRKEYKEQVTNGCKDNL